MSVYVSVLLLSAVSQSLQMQSPSFYIRPVVEDVELTVLSDELNNARWLFFSYSGHTSRVKQWRIFFLGLRFYGTGGPCTTDAVEHGPPEKFSTNPVGFVLVQYVESFEQAPRASGRGDSRRFHIAH
jgi:hypothetical protein